MTIPKGVITALVGQNGAGKTTLLHILATVDKPSSGKVLYGKVPLSRFRRRHRGQIGWVGHQPLVYDELTARENLRFFADLYGISNPEQIVQDWLERVDLTSVGDRPCSEYSRGMKQRLSIARALIHDPSLILLDEPLSGLDRDGRRRVLELLRELKHREKTLVIVTHDLQLTQDEVDTVGILHQGKLVEHHVLEAGEILLDAHQQHMPSMRI
jgi:heme exporter protein A